MKSKKKPRSNQVASDDGLAAQHSVCGQRYRVLIDGWKESGTRHCTKSKGHVGNCGKAANAALSGWPGKDETEVKK